MERPLISIIMPAYNAEKFIEETIQSVLSQEYTNWELIIVNDASKDQTEDIIRNYMKKESRISLYCLPQNSGSSAALNEALCHARGEYICWLSADDMYMPEMLSSSLGYLQQNPQKNAVFSCHEFINDKSEVISLWSPGDQYCTIGDENSCEPYLTLVLYGNAFNACTVLAKAELYKQTGFFNAKYRYANDYDYMMRLMSYSCVGFLNRVNVASRVHEGQVTNEGNNDLDAILVYAEMLKNDEVRKNLFRKAGMKDCRESVLFGFKNRVAFYENYSLFREAEEVNKQMNAFVKTFPKCVEADKYCDEMASLINEEDWGKAIGYMNALPREIADFINYEKYGILVASILEHEGIYDEERKILEEILNANNDNYEAHYMMGVVCERNGNKSEALDHYYLSVKKSEEIIEDNLFMVDNLRIFMAERY